MATALKNKRQVTGLAKIETHAKRIRDGHESVRPGQEFRMTTAFAPGDAVAQGDLTLEVVAGGPPQGYVEVNRPKASDRQLVPGQTQGARHCLDSLAGVKLWRPAKWTEESLDGPYFETNQERTVEHPVHGPVVIPAGMSILCSYEKEWDREQAKARRVAD